MEIVRYNPQLKEQWDAFVRSSKNGTFLFFRDYMDYHKDRFTDHSLMFYKDAELVALLPGNVENSKESKDSNQSIDSNLSNTSKILHSHQGLTYGGLILSPKTSTKTVCEIFRSLLDYARSQDIASIVYKCVPHVYHKQPSEEDLYALFAVCGARLVARGASSAIRMDERIKWRKGKTANLTKACRAGVRVGESKDFAVFWPILQDCLKRRYNLKPVHSLAEIELLARRFPDNIRLILAYRDLRDLRDLKDSNGLSDPNDLSALNDLALSGAVLYITDTCVHTQYLCSSEEGNLYGCNEAVLDYILTHYSHLRYFDYGISTEQGGRYLNESLISSKEGYGCRTIVYDTYEILI